MHDDERRARDHNTRILSLFVMIARKKVKRLYKYFLTIFVQVIQSYL